MLLRGAALSILGPDSPRGIYVIVSICLDIFCPSSQLSYKHILQRPTYYMSVTHLSLVIALKTKARLRYFATTVATIICTANQAMITHRTSSYKP